MKTEMTLTADCGSRSSHAGRMLLLLFPSGLALLSACSDQGVTGPGSSSACGAGGLIALGPLHSATLDCSNGGTTITLAGGGASYLVVPQLAAGDVPDRPVGYTLAVTGGTVLTASAQPGGASGVEASRGSTTRAWAPRRPRVTPGFLQRQFDAMRRASARAGLRSGRWRGPGSPGESISSSPTRPPSISRTSGWGGAPLITSSNSSSIFVKI